MVYSMEYYDIDVFGRNITTTSEEAQLWFNRGLTWSYAYFFDESERCFRNAIEADPNCAMAYWGLAYAAGPDYNMPWDKRDKKMRSESLATCFDATQSALGLVDTVCSRGRTNPHANRPVSAAGHYGQGNDAQLECGFCRCDADRSR